MPYANKEDKAAWARKYHEENRQKHAEYKKEWRQKQRLEQKIKNLKLKLV